MNELSIGNSQGVPAFQAFQAINDGAGRSSGRSVYFTLKRVLDLALSLPVLIAVSPIFLIVALLIRATSPGPVFFVQDRIGVRRVGGRWTLRTFRFIKFRTMHAGVGTAIHQKHVSAFIRGDSDARSAAQAAGLVAGTNKIRHDPRLTPVGRFLRRFSLDELPQLLNVIRGEMSLVGPRPPIPYEVEVYRPEHMRRLSVKPGITGLWQVSGRAILTFEEMVRLDLLYIEKMNLGLDLSILARTSLVVFSGSGE